MYGQLIELVFFAAIALLIINKLISVLGTTSSDEKLNHRKSFFGEVDSMKDVTSTSSKKENSVVHTRFSNKSQDSKFKDLVLEGHEEDVLKGLVDAINKIPSFNLETFLKKAQIAFKMLIIATQKEDEEQIGQLVDKRYINEFKKLSTNYNSYKADNEIHSKISEVYTFGNSVFVKILFIVMSKIDNNNLHEEWTFSKNSNDDSPSWYLTNIDRPS